MSPQYIRLVAALEAPDAPRPVYLTADMRRVLHDALSHYELELHDRAKSSEHDHQSTEAREDLSELAHVWKAVQKL